MFIMDPKDIPNTPKLQLPTYAKLVVTFGPQKEDPYCICMTTGGNLINYPGNARIALFALSARWQAQG